MIDDIQIHRELFGGAERQVGTTLAAKVQLSIGRLRTFEGQALSMHPDGYWLADSGGKDSCCILRLAQMAGVRFTAHYNNTGLDSPELVWFLRVQHPETRWIRPAKTMWQLIVEKRMPPTRKVRYCCEYLKEQGGIGRMVVLGVRWQESAGRSKRRMVESCRKLGAGRSFLNPIIDWTEADVWEFIRAEKIQYCSLYDEGWKRIGCIGCPMGGTAGRLRDFERWPRYKALYLRAFEAAVQAKRRSEEERAAKGHPSKAYSGVQAKWISGQAMMDWWLSLDDKHDPTDDQPWLFGG